MAKFVIVEPTLLRYRQRVHVPVVVRISDDSLAWEVYRTVLLTAYRMARFTYTLWGLEYYCSYNPCSFAHLTRFVNLKHYDGYLRQYKDTLLDEEEFRRIMREQILRHYTAKKEIRRRFKALEDFISMRLGRMRYPAVINCMKLNYVCKVPVERGAPKHDLYVGVLYLLEDRFCLKIGQELRMIFLPYDPSKVDVKAVRKLARRRKEFLHLAAEATDVVKDEMGELADSRLEDAVKTMNYVLFLFELLGV